jgi:hypothetical protein
MTSDRKGVPAHTEILDTVLKAVPHPHLLSSIDFGSDDVVRFTWRGTRYRVDSNFSCDEVGDGVLIGSDLAILMERTLKLSRALTRCGQLVMPA